MKLVAVAILATMLTACGTLGGALEGAGQDLSKAGGYIKKQ